MKPERMIDLSQLDELARRLSNLVPPGLREGREEFDVQRAVLLRTREKLDALEQRLAELADLSQPPRH